MIIILDTCAAIEVVLAKPRASLFVETLAQAEWVIAPDSFISEASNVFWKYHQFEQLPIKICETALEKSIQLVDDFVDSKVLYQEAFSLACSLKQPVYDALFLVLARRHNGVLMTLDKRMMKGASKSSIHTCSSA